MINNIQHIIYRSFHCSTLRYNKRVRLRWLRIKHFGLNGLVDIQQRHILLSFVLRLGRNSISTGIFSVQTQHVREAQ